MGSTKQDDDSEACETVGRAQHGVMCLALPPVTPGGDSHSATVVTHLFPSERGRRLDWRGESVWRNKAVVTH